MGRTGHLTTNEEIEDQDVRAGPASGYDPAVTAVRTPHDEDQRPDHPIHAAAEGGRLWRVRAFLDAEPDLVHLVDRFGGTPLHRAVRNRT